MAYVVIDVFCTWYVLERARAWCATIPAFILDESILWQLSVRLGKVLPEVEDCSRPLVASNRIFSAIPIRFWVF